MTHDFLADEYLKNEKIQIFIRLAFIFAASVSAYFYFQLHASESRYTFAYVMIAPLCVFIYNLFYLAIVHFFPYSLQKKRIIASVLMDIIITVYVMYLVESLAAYYAGALLWFSVAYGMRYSKTVAYTAYVTVILTWTILITTSHFWIQNSNFALGWLFAFIVLPLYYFKLVDKLHNNLNNLHHYAEESEHRALHDQLTGVPNRAMFEDELNQYIGKNKKFALFFIDLDSFKEINDLHGHDIGDMVLIEASKRLQSIIEDTYRLGGDEFVCVSAYKHESELRNLAKSLLFNLTMPCKNSQIILSASIGIARFPDDAKNKFDIKKRADLAMYTAKQAGKNRFHFYSEVA